MRRIALLLLAFVFAIASPLAHAGELTTDDGHVIRYDDGLDRVADRVAKLIPGIETTVERRLGFPLAGGPATIVIAGDVDSMRKAARARVPEWAAGVCIGSSLIVLRADKILPATPQNSPLTVLRHEWVHLSWARKSRFHRRNLPRWAEEGLAEEIGGGVSVDAGAALDIAAANNKLIPLEDIDGSFPSEEKKAGLAYRQGTSWINYVVKEVGWDAFRAVLHDLANGEGRSDTPGARKPFDVVLRKHTGRHLDEWVAEWRDDLEKDARPFFHIFGHDVGWTLLIFMSVLCLGFFFAHRARRKREIAELPDG